MPLDTFIHNLLNVLVQITNKMGLRKKMRTNLNYWPTLTVWQRKIITSIRQMLHDLWLTVPNGYYCICSDGAISDLTTQAICAGSRRSGCKPCHTPCDMSQSHFVMLRNFGCLLAFSSPSRFSYAMLHECITVQVSFRMQCQWIPVFPTNMLSLSSGSKWSRIQLSQLWSCFSFKTQLNSIGLSVPHRKHISSPLRAQQVNAIYRFVSMVY
jgi:hypothetical protein